MDLDAAFACEQLVHQGARQASPARGDDVQMRQVYREVDRALEERRVRRPVVEEERAARVGVEPFHRDGAAEGVLEVTYVVEHLFESVDRSSASTGVQRVDVRT
ncbi:MAG: hypothetical protein IPG17_20655 [Sandaracinaceae bacterium]|nr:hypothetical protein [Sandaracinaceae bacterium]